MTKCKLKPPNATQNSLTQAKMAKQLNGSGVRDSGLDVGGGFGCSGGLSVGSGCGGFDGGGFGDGWRGSGLGSGCGGSGLGGCGLGGGISWL